jgi:hypothetical protein
LILANHRVLKSAIIMLHPQAPKDQQENVLDVFLHRPSGNELWPLLMLHVTARTARRAPKADIRQRVNIVHKPIRFRLLLVVHRLAAIFTTTSGQIRKAQGLPPLTATTAATALTAAATTTLTAAATAGTAAASL